MTSLEEIKTAFVERVDTAWNEIKDQVDADKVRTYVQGLTAELLGHVYAVEAALVNHVLGKQDAPAPAPEPSPAPEQTVGSGAVTSDQPPSDPPAAQIDPASGPQTEPLPPAQSAPEGSVQEQPTGMAANPEPAPTDQPAAAAEPEQTA